MGESGGRSMSNPIEGPSAPSLESLRKRAKRLLHEVRGGNEFAVALIRKHLPRLASLDEVTLAERIVLADVQHAVALERGFESWAALRRHIESRQPVEAQAARFLDAIRAHDLRGARRILKQHPGIVAHSFLVACCVGDAARVEEALGRDPSLATAPHQPHGWQALLYACGSGFHTLSPAHARGVLRCVELLLAHGADPNAFMLFEPSDP